MIGRNRNKLKVPKIHFRQIGKNGNISMFFSYNYQRFQAGTGMVVEGNDWDKKRQRAKSHIRGRHDYVKINRELDKWEETAQQVYIDFDYGEGADYDQFKNEILYRMGKLVRPSEEPTELLPYLESYITEQKSKAGSTKSSWGKYEALLSHLRQYQKDTGNKVDFNKIDWDFKDKFEQWSYLEPRKFSSNNSAKLLSALKVVLREAYRKKIHENRIFTEKGYTIKRVATKNKVSFTLEELALISAHNFENDTRLDRVRDLMIFACWTGLRVSDWWKVSTDNVRVIDGQRVLQLVTKKTGTSVFIPIVPPLQKVLVKYDWTLPKISEQKFNGYIKEVIKIVLPESRFSRIYSHGGERKEEISYKWEFASSHAGRRTYATNAYLLSNSPAQVMQVTGHSTERQFFEYIDVQPQKLAASLSRTMADHFK